MKIKYEPGREPPPAPPTLEEVFQQIGKELLRLNHDISEERRHAVESQLRGIVRRAGFRFRESQGSPLSLEEIYNQGLIALKSAQWEIHEKHAPTVQMMVQAVLSNLRAESGLADCEEKEIPLHPTSDHRTEH